MLFWNAITYFALDSAQALTLWLLDEGDEDEF